MKSASAIRTVVRNGVDQHAPILRRAYRSVQDKRQISRSLATSYGFSLTGLQVASSGGWEKPEIQVFLKLIEKAQHCVDIGANVGFYSCLAASKGLQVISIEPLQANLKFLMKNLMDNDMENVEVFPIGLSETPGLKKIYGCRDVASLIEGWSGAVASVYNVVPVTTLDLLVGNRLAGTSTAIKMDVEGFELEVLRGAKNTLQLNPKPSWLLEILLNNEAVPGGINKRFFETFEVFWQNGYECRHVDPSHGPVNAETVSRWVRDRQVDFDACNFLFLPE